MTQIRAIKILVVLSVVGANFSCVKAPVDVALKDRIEISETQVREIADDIYEKLAEIDFTTPPPPTINPDECSAAYKIWLRKQFDRGLVPKATILPYEYAESSSNAAKHECRAVDFAKEYENALKKRTDDEETKRKAIVFGVSQFREKLISNKCTERILELNKEKIAIKSIHLVVRENTLTVKAPRYKLYSSYEDDGIVDEIESTLNAEDVMVKNGKLMLLGETKPIERRFTGRTDVDMNQDRESFFHAEGPVVSLSGVMVAVPGKMASEPEIAVVGKQEFYIVPSGKMAVTMATNIEISLHSNDAICAYNRFKDSIREELTKREEKEKLEREKITPES